MSSLLQGGVWSSCCRLGGDQYHLLHAAVSEESHLEQGSWDLGVSVLHIPGQMADVCCHQ